MYLEYLVENMRESLSEDFFLLFHNTSIFKLF